MIHVKIRLTQKTLHSHLRRGLRSFDIVAVMTLLLMACSGVSTSGKLSEPIEKCHTIAMVPFFEFRASEKGRSLARCPVTGEFISVGEIAPEASGVLTETFCSDLRLRKL